MQFKYGRSTFKTTVKDDAGKHAIWKESFVLANIAARMEDNLILEAMEKDIASSDFLGAIKPISFSELCEWEGRVKHSKVKLENEKGKVSGEITFETVFIWEDYVQPPSHPMLDKKAFLKITINSATFLKDADFIGK